MTDAPLVSCVVIFLNAEHFIEEAIHSVLAQTYHQWELLLVDDGSVDRSTAIAKHFAQQRPHQVRYLEHPGHQNLGMSASRNLGVAHSRGTYVGFLDADDLWLPHKLREQIRLLQAHPGAAMVYGPTQYWYSWTESPADLARDYEGRIGVAPNTLVDPPGLLRLALKTHGGTMPGICSVLLHRETIEDVGGFEVSFRGLYEDQAFLSKVFLTRGVLVTDVCVDRYRQHPTSACSTARASGHYHPTRPHLARRAFLEWLSAYLSKQNVEDPEIWQALDETLKPYRYLPLYRLLARLELPLKRLTTMVAPALKRTVLFPLYRRIRAAWHRSEYKPPVAWARLGDLRRVKPISRHYGYDRGTPVDRYYIERFLARHANDIRGRVLEIGDAAYTRQFGGDRVTISDVLHLREKDNPAVTIVGDLTCADHVPSDAFDCFILTQTLQLIYDVPAALKTAYRVLKPGGVLLATVPGVSQISSDEWGKAWYWGFTSLSTRCRFEEIFRKEDVEVVTHGNVLVATAFLYGLSAEELSQEELDYFDRDYEMLITVRAVKPATTARDDLTSSNIGAARRFEHDALS